MKRMAFYMIKLDLEKGGERVVKKGCIRELEDEGVTNEQGRGMYGLRRSLVPWCPIFCW
jgi:hypothetical protein